MEIRITLFFMVTPPSGAILSHLAQNVKGRKCCNSRKKRGQKLGTAAGVFGQCQELLAVLVAPAVDDDRPALIVAEVDVAVVAVDGVLDTLVDDIMKATEKYRPSEDEEV